ncbi:hypothetical protein BU26DRAFT_32123 [Trematosphaeria pertusa]|uniref:Flavin reductase like domain-containing protein n=1 Tax=Trematosphaeria pertusa TaxID=390896 RepID=A0A6A6J2Y2_9PLEO|nr:uncharacterized protein BU26DRAFT_32123 [Trematosphaeria pertusa]KAF2256928.1 hypothetical protein BU26DRAFT_32123 [Trematosphaeria pertusa]
MPHIPISPAILYWGTPVVLVTTTNPAPEPNPSSTSPTQRAAPANIGPISSAWWLGHCCMLGLDASSATTQNLLCSRQCVLNLPSDDMAPVVNALARTTGTPSLPPHKLAMGYRYEGDKFRAAGLTPLPSSLVAPPRIAQCPVAMECEVAKVHTFMEHDAERAGFVVAVECKVVKIWIDERLKMEGYRNRVDPDLWRPLIMSFQELYGLSGRRKDRESVLGAVEEENYRILAAGSSGEAEGDTIRSGFLPEEGQ